MALGVWHVRSIVQSWRLWCCTMQMCRRGVCPQIKKSVAQTPFNVLCQVLCGVTFQGPGGAGVQTWTELGCGSENVSAGPAPAGEQCLLWLEVTLEESFCLFC